MTKCTINNTDNYVESVLVRPVVALPGQYQIVIQSQLLDAKDPTALQVKYQTIVSAAALIEFRDLLNKVII